MLKEKWPIFDVCLPPEKTLVAVHTRGAPEEGLVTYGVGGRQGHYHLPSKKVSGLFGKGSQREAPRRVGGPYIYIYILRDVCNKVQSWPQFCNFRLQQLCLQQRGSLQILSFSHRLFGRKALPLPAPGAMRPLRCGQLAVPEPWIWGGQGKPPEMRRSPSMRRFF